MKKTKDISNVDPEAWKLYVSTSGYDATGYSIFAIRFLLTVLLRPVLFAEVIKEPSRFQKWYYANRARRIAVVKKYNSDHRQELREAAKRWHEGHRQERARYDRNRQAIKSMYGGTNA